MDVHSVTKDENLCFQSISKTDLFPLSNLPKVVSKIELDLERKSEGEYNPFSLERLCNIYQEHEAQTLSAKEIPLQIVGRF